MDTPPREEILESVVHTAEQGGKGCFPFLHDLLEEEAARREHQVAGIIYPSLFIR
jgi:hypothetical protein